MDANKERNPGMGRDSLIGPLNGMIFGLKLIGRPQKTKSGLLFAATQKDLPHLHPSSKIARHSTIPSHLEKGCHDLLEIAWAD